MWLTSSSIGRKFVMALTGAFLVLFVTFHVLMNGVALFWPTAYNAVCEFLGANWYALIGTAILAGGFLLHILYALWLTYENRRARGNDRYAVTSRPKQVEWSSKNMLVLGIVVLCFLAVHLIQFWAKMQLPEVLGLEGEFPAAAGTLYIQQAFSCPVTLIVYLIGFAALWFHMTHGFWSMCQSSGLNNGVWMNRLKAIGCTWATVVVLLFAVEAVVFTVQAKRNFYTTNPALLEQYMEMAPACNCEGCEGCESCADCNCAAGKCAESCHFCKFAAKMAEFAGCNNACGAACGETACGEAACGEAACDGCGEIYGEEIDICDDAVVCTCGEDCECDTPCAGNCVRNADDTVYENFNEGTFN